MREMKSENIMREMEVLHDMILFLTLFHFHSVTTFLVNLKHQSCWCRANLYPTKNMQGCTGDRCLAI